MSDGPLDPLQVAVRVGTALESVGAAYFLGGSLASSLQGEPRSTNDIDFVIELAPWSVPRFVAALGGDFAVDPVALTNALRRGGTTNIFFLPLVMKIDLFARGDKPFDEAEFQRRRTVSIGSAGAESAKLWIKSPEDSVLRKLLWYEEGGRVSERQWRDVVALLRVGGPTLEWVYLDTWANRLRLSELLEGAMRDAGVTRPPR